ncbi:hypothetical protein BC939DRAFT_446801 [Gamsiella multidivaricata]|uniref:uncharacterized protein n=1 Tax=Gamsiella multidivaricata TaxID=101098 RepID=UPI00221FB9DF|nr:uncharacterized protein BC939DRAFT_446801 [Gamsiella multidivaricata]KAI7826569.1 hypothetical protein BC939DRAFT_446801 [Gamsiella multidivaricata]
MCQRTICRDCGKFTWTGCGLHITEVLAGLPLEQICSCDDDRDSEHPWTTLKNQSAAEHPTPQYPATGATISAFIQPRKDPTGHCADPSPIEYKLSKISSATADAAASRMAQQAAALEELRRLKRKEEQELKDVNESALKRLLHGLSETTEESGNVD